MNVDPLRAPETDEDHDYIPAPGRTRRIDYVTAIGYGIFAGAVVALVILYFLARR